MPKRPTRGVWRVDFPASDPVWLRHLKSVKVQLAAYGLPESRIYLVRLERGRYYHVVRWSSPAGLVAGVVMVTRQRGRAAERERVNERLPYDEVTDTILDEHYRRGV